MEKQERKRASLRSDGKTGKEVSTDELNASMPIRSVHAAEYGCPQLTPCGRHRLERVVGIDWNAWSPSVGTRGRFQWNTQHFHAITVVHFRVVICTRTSQSPAGTRTAAKAASTARVWVTGGCPPTRSSRAACKPWVIGLL